MCKVEVKNEFDQAEEVYHPTKGLHLYIDTGYGMFADFYDNEGPRNIRLCHSCSVKFIEMFPPDFQQEFRGGHPVSEEEEPCCKFAWHGIDGVHHESWPDGVWHATSGWDDIVV
jgi:hypothetical protein